MKYLSIKYIDSSLLALIFSMIVVIYVSFNHSTWKSPKNIIVNEVLSYYGYLPATFIYNDITLEFTKKIIKNLGANFGAQKALQVSLFS